MSEQKMREEFEAWIASIWQGVWLKRNADNAFMFAGQYLEGSVQMAWKGWQASREALVIELPQQSGVNLDWNQAIRYCHQAIEAAGVKVKQ